MDDSLQSDLTAAHADALIAGDDGFYDRYTALFPLEMQLSAALFTLAEWIRVILSEPAAMRPEFRSDLKAGLVAQAHQQNMLHGSNWRWAAIGASAVTVAGVIVAAAWRGSHSSTRLSR